MYYAMVFHAGDGLSILNYEFISCSDRRILKSQRMNSKEDRNNVLRCKNTRE